MQPTKSHMSKFRIATALLTLSGMALFSAVSYAQEFPTRPVKMVIPYPPGGATDVTGRVIADKMTPVLGQPVVIENRPGAGSQVGNEYAAKAAPDGYTVLYTSNSIALLPYTNKTYSLNVEKDVIPVAQCCIAPLILAVPASLPVKNVAEAAAYFKSNSGKINFAASGVSDALAGTTFGNAAGFKFENMRYNGGAPATQALVAGDVQFVMLPLGTIKPMADAGRVRIIAVTSLTRYPGLPDVPTVAESIKPGYSSTFWNGIYVPAGTPAAIVTKLNAAFNSAMRMDEIKKKIGEYHMVPLLATPEQTRSAILADLAAWSEAAKAAGVKPE